MFVLIATVEKFDDFPFSVRRKQCCRNKRVLESRRIIFSCVTMSKLFIHAKLQYSHLKSRKEMK